MDKRVIPNLYIFAKVAPFVWFVFGAYMLITGHFQVNNFVNAFIALTVYFTLGTAISSFLAFIPAIPYILLTLVTLFVAKMNIPAISITAALLYNLLIIIFILVVALWTIYIGNWTIGTVTRIL